jgi:hypothetical protein
MFHVSLLEPYHASTIPRRIHDPPSPIEINVEHEYEIVDILNSRISNRQLQYLDHWHGYDVNERTWACLDIIDETCDPFPWRSIKNMKWRTFWIQEFLIVNSNI